jgi:hypothetical protein
LRDKQFIKADMPNGDGSIIYKTFRRMPESRWRLAYRMDVMNLLVLEVPKPLIILGGLSIMVCGGRSFLRRRRRHAGMLIVSCCDTVKAN